MFLTLDFPFSPSLGTPFYLASLEKIFSCPGSKFSILILTMQRYKEKAGLANKTPKIRLILSLFFALKMQKNHPDMRIAKNLLSYFLLSYFLLFSKVQRWAIRF